MPLLEWLFLSGLGGYQNVKSKISLLMPVMPVPYLYMYKKYLLIILLSLAVMAARSQNDLQVTFREQIPSNTAGSADHSTFFSRYCYLFYTGSVSFFSYSNTVSYKKGRISEGILHHSVFYDRFKKAFYSPVLLSRKKRYMLEKQQTQQWTLINGEKMICGINCKKAMMENTGQDSVIAWYVPGLPLPYGPVYYGGLPGIILCIRDDQQHRSFIAVSVVPFKGELMLPGLPVMRKEEH